MNITYFLGAGFSAAFSLPIMGSFFRTVGDSPNVSDEDKTFLSELRREAQAANALLDGDDTNLEHVLSFAVMGVRLSLNEPTTSRYDRLRRIIRQVYTTTPNTFRPRSAYASAEAMFNLSDRYVRSDKFSIITTNYDIHAEWAMSHIGLRVLLPGQCKSLTPSETGRNRRSLYDLSGAVDGFSVSLCKLHGSVNWKVDAAHPGVLIVDDGLVHLHSLDDSDRQHSFVMPAALRHKDPHPYIPVLVPPTYFKQDIDPALKPAWIQAAESLRTADIVIFIGYSFPQSDTDMRYFLATTMTQNINLRKIMIVDPNAEAIIVRLKGSGGMGTRFCRLLHPFSGVWQDVLHEAVDRRNW